MIGLTGVTGYVGKALSAELLKRKIKSRFFCREKSTANNFFTLDALNYDQNSLNLLSGIDCLIHCAGISGIENNKFIDKKKYFEKINVDFTFDLANAAAKLGVKRFIFISSAKVNGEKTDINKPFKITDKAAPQTLYSKSKLDAENKIIELSKKSNLEVVIIRPPAVYGNEHKGNIKKLSLLIKKKIPIPLGGIENKRSFISMENLVDFILFCTTSKDVINEIFFVSDDHDISTPELIKVIARGFNKYVRLIYMPKIFIKIMHYLIENTNVASQLFNSFQIDISYTKEKTGWKPIKKVNK